MTSPGRVVNKRLRLVFGELLGLELVNGGYSRPVVFCGSACGGTFIRPSYSRALPRQLRGFFFFFFLSTMPRGLNARDNVIKGSYLKSPACSCQQGASLT